MERSHRATLLRVTAAASAAAEVLCRVLLPAPERRGAGNKTRWVVVVAGRYRASRWSSLWSAIMGAWT